MIIARQGTKRNHFAFGLPMVGLFLAVLFLSVAGHAVESPGYCGYSDMWNNDNNKVKCSEADNCARFEGEYTNSDGSTTFRMNCYSNGCRSSYGVQYHNCYCDYCRVYNICEKDSIRCMMEGGTWTEDPSAESCGKSCQAALDSSICDGPRQACINLGGKFSGGPLHTSSGDCCSGVCDMCNSASVDKLWNTKRQICCSQLLAPPAKSTRCSNPLQSGCGISQSNILTDDNEWECQDPNLDTATANRYMQVCDEKYSSAEQDSLSSSSSEDGGGSSSSDGGDGSSSDSGGGGTSSPYPEGCDECPYLDSILDTLTKEKHRTDDIYTCLIMPDLCPALKFPDSIKTPVFGFDTAFRKYLQPLMDSLLKVDSNQLKALLMLDTNILKLLATDTSSLKNDTVTWTKFDALGNVIDTSVHVVNDTMRKWFRRIADSIGVSTDSLAAHLDSILSHIPDSVLDSIVKYQQYATDNFDSVLYGTGKGFSLVDSLIDSAVKYFTDMHHYDSVYRVLFSDSVGSIHSAIDDLPGRNASAMGSALGYGDTASTSLRGDLNGIRESIEGLGDTNGLGGHGGGIGDSLGRYRDSINKYYISDGRFGELVDSTEAAWGVDSLDARWESSYAYGLCEGDDCPPCSDDSCMGSLSGNFVQRADSIARIAGDSLEASTKRQRDSLPTFWDTTFKEFKEYSWFGSFDSTFLANIGAKIPNSNTCPEHCFAMDVNGTYAYVGYNMHLDWKLCRPIAPNVLNSLNAFDILKLLARILTVVTCLSILMWEVSSRRGGGIGL